jgi:hypothetical protein
VLRRSSRRTRTRALVGSIAGALALAASVEAAPTADRVPMQPRTRQPAIVFGIYPGGAAGTVGPTPDMVQDNLSQQLAALHDLRTSGLPFVLRLYANYSGRGSPSALDQVGSQITEYTSAGFQIELVLTYRPTDQAPMGDVPGFVRFVQSTVDSFGRNRDFTFLQVTNEANIVGAPHAADGYYARAVDALIQGVIAAKRRASEDGADQLAVGFNWAYSLDPHDSAFWRSLAHGGPAFRRSVDWVGLDIYPLTWGPRPEGHGLVDLAEKTMVDALAALRDRFMPLARLLHSVAVHITECGYPTGPDRTDATQAVVLRTAVTLANAERARFNITQFRWFDLRDADSSSTNFESRYGLMRDDYSPKPAYALYRRLIATLGTTG